MNVFHAVQYFAIVWIKEKDNLQTRFRLTDTRHGKLLLAGLFIAPLVIYGIIYEWVEMSSNWFYALMLTVTLLHFWYDGFIWSVRKKQV
jgi:hypothetical protein